MLNNMVLDVKYYSRIKFIPSHLCIIEELNTHLLSNKGLLFGIEF